MTGSSLEGKKEKEEIGHLETWRFGEVGWGGRVFFLFGGDLRSGWCGILEIVHLGRCVVHVL